MELLVYRLMRYFWFSYRADLSEIPVAPQKKDTQQAITHERWPKPRELGLHRVRDGAAFAEIGAILQNVDYEYGGLLLNIPRIRERRELQVGRSPSLPPHDADSQELAGDDILVLPTRPPLNDDPEYDKKPVFRSDSSLEQEVFASLSKFFDWCDRRQVQLARKVFEPLKDQIDNRRLTFSQYGPPASEQLRRRTAGFLVFDPEMRPNGPAILCVFGMAGLETLTWAHWLRVKTPELVTGAIGSKRKTFILAVFEEIPECTNVPTTLRTFENVKMKLFPPVYLH